MGIQGLGGVFIKVKNKQETINWYRDKLNLKFQEDSVVFNKQTGQAEVLAFFAEESEYYRNTECMINFKVEKLESFIEELKAKGVRIEEKIAKYDYGKFAWIYDNNDNKIELWESND
jgi:predicted enzyme related to lactoylglutathione lyase